ncbi:MAG: UDP-4-amino-4,6-dideoxy-N-acetyl-beta-L-altrosamine transaminase [Bacteroidales bacterium]|nr:UDP-4-amino-4,6-dideoxy-N-acetyl-beta-L-altrosamine transaminase [Bacteroidales bacterium]
MTKPIPYGRQNITQEDIDAVVEVLRSDWLTQGPKIREFEEAFKQYVGVKYALAVSNGTAALHLCSIVMDVKPGDKIITTPITFAATANCIRYCGGEVVFADIDPDTYLLDIREVRDILMSAPKGTYKGIIVVDFTGRPTDLECFRTLANEFGLWIIEDACHAPGGYFIDSKRNKQKCGNGQFADLAVFSFHPVKHITTGEGGMITTNNEELYFRLCNLRTHGIQQRQELMQFNHGLWYYEMQELGFNYRITDIQSALGRSQLKRADENLIKRKEIAALYHEALNGKDYIIRQSELIPGHSFHLYVAEFKNRNGLIQYLRNNGINSQVHYIPLHLMPYYRKFGWKEGDLKHSEDYYRHCLSLPIYPTLRHEEQNFVIDKINDFYLHSGNQRKTL